MAVFSPGDSLGSLPLSQIAAYLVDIEDLDGARHFSQGAVAGQSFLSPKKAYQHTGMVLGFVEPNPSTISVCRVVGMSEVAADDTLIDDRIKISMDKFYVRSYPGLGQHNVLCEFSGRNQIAGETEQLRFAVRFKVVDGGAASVMGVPLFLGVTVGPDGIAFEGRSINVSSTTDETILEALDSPAFKQGLTLLSAAQPALKPFTGLAAAAVKATISRGRNKQIHSFDLGLDFASTPTSARLRCGSYVVVQTDDASTWNWADYQWQRDGMTLQPTSDPAAPIPYNYMVFSVSRFSGPAAVPAATASRKRPARPQG